MICLAECPANYCAVGAVNAASAVGAVGVISAVLAVGTVYAASGVQWV